MLLLYIEEEQGEYKKVYRGFLAPLPNNLKPRRSSCLTGLVFPRSIETSWLDSGALNEAHPIQARALAAKAHTEARAEPSRRGTNTAS
jgi:hypothetical protein